MLTYIYAFIFGYITAKIFSGKHEHIKGPLGILLVSIRKIKIHIHHWILGFLFTVVIIFFKAISIDDINSFDLHLISFFIGIMFQGIYEFNDWKEIIEKV